MWLHARLRALHTHLLLVLLLHLGLPRGLLLLLLRRLLSLHLLLVKVLLLSIWRSHVGGEPGSACLLNPLAGNTACSGTLHPHSGLGHAHLAASAAHPRPRLASRSNANLSGLLLLLLHAWPPSLHRVWLSNLHACRNRLPWSHARALPSRRNHAPHTR